MLPSAQNLWKRKVLLEPICQRCNSSVETIYHALLDCKTAKKVWMQGPFTIPLPNTQTQDILSFFQEMAKNLRKSKLELMVAYCWVVLHSRNKFIFEGQKLESSLVAARA